MVSPFKVIVIANHLMYFRKGSLNFSLTKYFKITGALYHYSKVNELNNS